MRWALLLAAMAWPGAAQAEALTLACLDVGRMVEACRASGQRFEAATGHTVRVVAADGEGRASLGLYRALFDVASPKLDVVQLPDAWVPAFAGDLATLPPPDGEVGLPTVVAIGTDGERLVALPQHVAVTLLYTRTDLIGAPPSTWEDLNGALLAAPSGVGGLAFGGVGPTFFPMFLDFASSSGGKGLVDRDGLVTILTAMNEAIGNLTEASVANATAADAVQSLLNGDASALVADSTALAAIGTSPVAADVAAVPRPDPVPDAPVILSTWFAAVSRHSRHTDAATALVVHLASAEEQRRAALAFAIAPARPALYAEPQVAAAGPQFARVASTLPRLVPPPIATYRLAYLDLSAEVSEAVQRMLRGEADPEPTATAILAAVRRARYAVSE